MSSNPATAVGGVRLSIDLLGGFAIGAGGNPLDFRNRKACAILSYLLLENKFTETRERLAGLLWSEFGEEKARASLRQCLRQLRELFDRVGFTGFDVIRSEVRLDADDLEVDCLAMVSAVKAGRVAERLLRENDLPGQLLQGFDELDPAFRSWLVVKRQTLVNTFAQCLEALMEDDGAPQAMRDKAADALIHLDPTHEKACRSIIASLASKGHIAGALRIYNQLWELLGEDYDMEPAEETQQLIARVKAGPEQQIGLPEPEPAISTPSETPSDSYLPIIGMTKFIQSPADPDDDYIVEGFRRDLIASLVRFREWVILDRDDITASSVISHDNTLGVGSIDYLIEGTGFGAEDERHLIITLKVARTGQYVWSERYRLSTNNWFATQQKIIRRISAALNIHVSADRLAKQVATPSMPLGAYDLWLKGQALIDHWRPGTENQAEEIFRTITEQTPNFSPAYSSLASIYNSKHIVFPGVFRSRELEARAHRYAMIAVATDPLDTRAQLALAWSNAMGARYEQAEIHYGLSYDLNNSNPTTLISCAQGYAFCGQPEQALSLSETALRINPMLSAFHWGYLVGIRFICEDYKGSVEAADSAQDVITNLPAWKAAALALMDRRDEACAAADHFLAIVKANWVGETPCTKENAVEWCLHSFPIRDTRVCERLREGLRLSGLPIPR